MSLEEQFVGGLQIVLAGVLSLLIGLDRERRRSDAGLRTHLLVGVGACIFTVISMYAFDQGDPGRIASQILPGIGFIGAGAILKEGTSIRGLTTATSIWVTAAIGLAVGVGAWFLAIIGTIVAWVILALLVRIESQEDRGSSV